MKRLPQLFLFKKIYSSFEILEKLLSVRHLLFYVVLLSNFAQSLGPKAVLSIKKILNVYELFGKLIQISSLIGQENSIWDDIVEWLYCKWTMALWLPRTVKT